MAIQPPPPQPLIPMQAVRLLMALDLNLDALAVDIDLGDGSGAMGIGTPGLDGGVMADSGRARNATGSSTGAGISWRTQPAVHYRAD